MKAIFASVNKNSPIGFRNHVILLTILDTGLRASEAAGICLGNMNVDDGYIKKSVLAQYEWAVLKAEVERSVRQRKLEHMRELPDYLVPDSCDEKNGNTEDNLED
jgi:integrase